MTELLRKTGSRTSAPTTSRSCGAGPSSGRAIRVWAGAYYASGEALATIRSFSTDLVPPSGVADSRDLEVPLIGSSAS